MFTPLLFVSYELDLSLLGYQPRLFNVHQLISIVVATLALYLVLRLWLKPWLKPLVAGIACVVFITGVPFAEWAQLVMTRHYLDGLTLSALATVL